MRAGDERHLNVEYQNIEFVAIQTMNNELTDRYDDNLQTVNTLTVIPNTKGEYFWGQKSRIFPSASILPDLLQFLKFSYFSKSF